MGERVRVAMVGAGGYARMGLLPGLQARSDVEVVAVVDPGPAACEAARRLVPEAAAYPDVEAHLQAQAPSCAAVGRRQSISSRPRTGPGPGMPWSTARFTSR
jgi:predicted dehydrogenase